MPWKTRVLVVANRTAGSDELRRALCDRARAGSVEFTLIVPATPARTGDGAVGREAAQRRLDEALARLREAGLEIAGRVADPDPIVAVHEAWDPGEFDAVVVSTLPTGSSRWLALDLPRRIARMTGAPVEHVEARPRGAAAVPPPSPPPEHEDWTAVLTGRELTSPADDASRWREPA